jgi:probable addiction module antidote protein
MTTKQASPKAPISRSNDAMMVEMLKEDPAFANEYLAAALDEADAPDGQAALLTALRHIAEAQGMAAVAERAGIPRESLYRALSPRGNPTIKTLLAVLAAAGLHLGVTRSTMPGQAVTR